LSSESSERLAPVGIASATLRPSWAAWAAKAPPWRQHSLLKLALGVAAGLAVIGIYAAASHPDTEAPMRQIAIFAATATAVA